jgi:hypothetical protein
MLNLKNNLIPILNLWRQLILKRFNLLALALTPKGKLSDLKDYNDFTKVDTNKVNTNNILSFIDYSTIDK